MCMTDTWEILTQVKISVTVSTKQNTTLSIPASVSLTTLVASRTSLPTPSFQQGLDIFLGGGYMTVKKVTSEQNLEQ